MRRCVDVVFGTSAVLKAHNIFFYKRTPSKHKYFKKHYIIPYTVVVGIMRANDEK